MAKLVARDVENLQTLVLEPVIHRFQVLILWCEAAACGGVDDKEHLALILFQTHFVAFLVLKTKIINCLHILCCVLSHAGHHQDAQHGKG